jgi:putative intracellular protease/amidase
LFWRRTSRILVGMAPDISEPARRRVGILVFDGVKMLDFAGPAEVFVEANQAQQAGPISKPSYTSRRSSPRKAKAPSN